jgi:uncharacterized protein with HEPN domain
MPRDYRLYLDDILSSIDKIRQYTAGTTFEDFRNDEKCMDAVIRNLEVIGEAVKNLPQEVRDKHPEPEWKKMAGIRDILAHEYFGVDAEIIWDILQNKLPVLKSQIDKIKMDVH